MFSVQPLEPRTLLAALPAGFSETQVASGLAAPTAMAFAPDGRLFITEQTGALRIVKNSALLPTPFVTLRVTSSGERGLLGVTFDPNFAANHFVYVYYTVPGRRHTPAHNRVSRFTDSNDLAVKHSEVILLDITPLSDATNHNGGAIHFGLDGKLYIATGENNNGANAQDITNLLGKILRINADGTIPTDNPFYADATGSNKAIWAIGLRNPFNFSFDAATGQMLINDVGEHTYEEINVGAAGANYGWPFTEGPTHRHRFRAPIFYYTHGDTLTTGRAIVGSAFYSPANGRTFPRNYAGDYFFADLTSGWIRRLDPATGDVAAFASGIDTPVALAVNDDGSLYYLARGSGDATGIVERIQYTG
jgi:glucose/arabinose dehydrogenase